MWNWATTKLKGTFNFDGDNLNLKLQKWDYSTFHFWQKSNLRRETSAGKKIYLIIFVRACCQKFKIYKTQLIITFQNSLIKKPFNISMCNKSSEKNLRKFERILQKFRRQINLSNYGVRVCPDVLWCECTGSSKKEKRQINSKSQMHSERRLFGFLISNFPSQSAIISKSEGIICAVALRYPPSLSTLAAQKQPMT